jgi:hypothetical protein
MCFNQIHLETYGIATVNSGVLTPGDIVGLHIHNYPAADDGNKCNWPVESDMGLRDLVEETIRNYDSIQGANRYGCQCPVASDNSHY